MGLVFISINDEFNEHAKKANFEVHNNAGGTLGASS